LKNIKVIRFKPDDNLLAIGDVSGNIELWDINLKTKISEVKAADAQIKDIKFNTALNQMAAASTDKKLKLYNVKDPADLTEPPITFTDFEEWVLVMQFSQNGELIITGAAGGANNMVSRPTHADNLIKEICTIVSRNMTESEWKTYVGTDIKYEKTCAEKSYNIKVNAIK